MKERRFLLFLSTILGVLLGKSRGSLTLTLKGYDFIPTDGSGRILITDIGTNNIDSLVCQSSEATTTHTTDWYYNPTSLSLNPSERITVPDELERGWFRNRDIESRLVRLLRVEETANSLEGVFTCEVAEDPASPISVGIYYPNVVIDVQSAREGTFSVTCTARGGTVLNSSLTGPATVPHELQPVGRLGLRGDDTYSITTPSLSRGANGDTYQCIATNGASTPDPSDSATLTVAGPPIIESAEQISDTSIGVEWSHPSGGATVTGYVVHYTDGTFERSMSLAASSTSANITGLIGDRTYAISVEATSIQLSGVSHVMFILGESSDTPPRDSGTTSDIGVLYMAGSASLVVMVIFLAGVILAAVMIRKRRQNNTVKVSNPTRVEISGETNLAQERVYSDLQSNMVYGEIEPQPNVAYGCSFGESQTNVAYGCSFGEPQPNVAYGCSFGEPQSSVAYDCSFEESQTNVAYGCSFEESQTNVAYGCSFGQCNSGKEDPIYDLPN